MKNTAGARHPPGGIGLGPTESVAKAIVGKLRSAAGNNDAVLEGYIGKRRAAVDQRDAVRTAVLRISTCCFRGGILWNERNRIQGVSEEGRPRRRRRRNSANSPVESGGAARRIDIPLTMKTITRRMAWARKLNWCMMYFVDDKCGICSQGECRLTSDR